MPFQKAEAYNDNDNVLIKYQCKNSFIVLFFGYCRGMDEGEVVVTVLFLFFCSCLQYCYPSISQLFEPFIFYILFCTASISLYTRMVDLHGRSHDGFPPA